MTDDHKIQKAENAQALATAVYGALEKKIAEITAALPDPGQTELLSPAEMQQVIIRITGALEDVAETQHKILRQLQLKNADNVYR